MANHPSHASLPYPVKGARYTVQIPYVDADGDPTNPTTPDTEISKDGGAFADCTEEVTVVSGNNGLGYVTLTGDETTASMVAICAKAASGPKATLMTLYPRLLPVLYSGTAADGDQSIHYSRVRRSRHRGFSRRVHRPHDRRLGWWRHEWGQQSSSHHF